MKKEDVVDILKRIHERIDAMIYRLSKIERQLSAKGVGRDERTDEIPKGESPGEDPR